MTGFIGSPVPTGACLAPLLVAVTAPSLALSEQIPAEGRLGETPVVNVRAHAPG